MGLAAIKALCESSFRRRGFICWLDLLSTSVARLLAYLFLEGTLDSLSFEMSSAPMRTDISETIRKVERGEVTRDETPEDSSSDRRGVGRLGPSQAGRWLQAP
jgi:hypothetical protein